MYYLQVEFYKGFAVSCIKPLIMPHAMTSRIQIDVSTKTLRDMIVGLSR